MLCVPWQDRIYPVHKFLLQRTVRVQFLNIVKKTVWCEALSIKFQKALTNIGFFGYFDKGGCVCVKDVSLQLYTIILLKTDISDIAANPNPSHRGSPFFKHSSH